MPALAACFGRCLHPAVVLAAALGTAPIELARAAEDARPPASSAGDFKGVKPKAFTDADHKFVVEASAVSTTAIAMGRVAAKHGGLSQVRVHGASLVKDHTRALAELRRVAAIRGIKVAEEPPAEQMRALDALRGMPASKFDAYYAKTQGADYATAIALYRRQAERGADAELKQFAAATLPLLEAHKKKADAMR